MASDSKQQLDSMRRVVSSGLVAFLVACVHCLTEFLAQTPPNWPLLPLLVWVSTWGMAYWYGSDHDADWWFLSKKKALQPIEVVFSSLLILVFVALPVLLSAAFTDTADPASAVERVLWLATGIRVIDLLARDQLVRGAKKHIDRGPIYEFLTRRGHYVLIIVELIVTLMSAISYNYVYCDEVNIVVGVVLLAVLVCTERLRWGWREQAISGPE